MESRSRRLSINCAGPERRQACSEMRRHEASFCPYTPFHVRVQNVLLSMGIKIHRSQETNLGKESKCADSIMNNSLLLTTEPEKTYINLHLGFPFWLSLYSLHCLFTTIQIYEHPGEIEWTSPLHSTNALLTGYISKLR